MNQILKLYSRTKPVFYEGLIVYFLGLIVIFNITATDISFHGNYVGFLIAKCYPSNHDKLCDDFRDYLHVPRDAQMELGNPYWNELARQALFIGITMFLLRLGISFLLSISHMQKMRLSSWLMAVLYGAVGYGLFVFGILDTLYCLIVYHSLPTDLAWLNHAGVFEFSKAWHGDVNVVDSVDLILTNIVGIVMISGILLFTMIAFEDAKVKKGIA